MSDKTGASQYRDLQRRFAEYLKAQGKSDSMVSMIKSDAFYLANNDSSIDFMALLHSEDFDTAAFEQIKKTVYAKSNAQNKATTISGYLKCLHQLRDFVVIDKITQDIQVVKKQHLENKEVDPHIPTPSCSEVERYLRRWNTTPSLYKPECVLRVLFTQMHPYNVSIEDIILKAAALNTVYNTRIYSVFPVAQHILNLAIDDRLRKGDTTLVNEIMRVVYENGRIIEHYSFATKYCSFHNPDAFPIYDSYVGKVLVYYRDKLHFSNFRDCDLKDYSIFKRVIGDFRHCFGLEKYSVKQLDQFLWQFGKEYFK